MKKFVTRAIIIALIGSTGILSGCYGPFRLTTKLHQWNGNVSVSYTHLTLPTIA